jgi:hypothetical protein
MRDWSWYEEGFLWPPVLWITDGWQSLYRVWGGQSSEKGRANSAGVCFSFGRPGSRWEAEKLFAVFEYGNAVLHLSEFLAPPGTPRWVGTVHPGKPRAPLGHSGGTQVFIENPRAQSLLVKSTSPVPNDIGDAWVYLGRPPRVSS